MKRRSLALVEPIAGVERQKFHFSSLGQIRWLVDDQPTGADTCLDGHVNEDSTGTAAQQALAAVGGWCDPEPPRLKRKRYADKGHNRVKARHARALAESERDCKAYALARSYLLARPVQGITEELLEHYVRPPRASLTPQAMGGVFHRLLLSARNRNMMATVIPDAIVDSLGPVLGGFDPVKVTTRFTSPDHLLDTIIREIKPAGQLRRSRAGLWPLFSRATLSGARFLNQFADGAEFLAWVQTFDDDPRKRAALPLLLSQEVNGFGFALACDFLKELGFFNFAKPDVHVKAIVKGLHLSTESPSDYLVFKVVSRIAQHCGRTAYDVDKTFWLVGSGYFYDHKSLGRNGRVATDRDEFIRNTSRALTAA